MSRLLKVPCHSIWTGRNQLTGSIPSELGKLTSLTTLSLCTWIGLSFSDECHACSHFLAIMFHQIIINSQVQFRSNSEKLRRWLICRSVRGLVYLVHVNATRAHISLTFLFEQIKINSRVQFQANSKKFGRWLTCRSVRGLVFLFVWMSRLLTFPCHSVRSGDNQVTGSIPSELGGLTSLTKLWLGKWIGLSCWHECHACSQFLAIIFEQMKKMIWLATSIRSFVMVPLRGPIFVLIAYLKLSATAALSVIKVDKGPYRVINEDHMIDKAILY
jgi:hypothetical protein